MKKNEKKVCSKCKKEKPLSGFYKDKTKRFGRGATCRNCCKIYRMENKEGINNYAKKYRQANREKIKECQKIYRTENKEKIRQGYKKWEDLKIMIILG